MSCAPAINEAADYAAYALMPIVMTDPAKNPRVGSMVLSLAAVWETSPQDTQFAQFPALVEGWFPDGVGRQGRDRADPVGVAGRDHAGRLAQIRARRRRPRSRRSSRSTS